MSLTESQSLRVVVYEGEGSDAMNAEARFDTMTS